MLAKKCDRCGKLYEHYGMIYDTKKNGISLIFINKFGDREGLVQDIDLCKECMNSLTNWLKRGEEYESE